MGDDIRVVNAARVSFNKESEWVKGESYEDYDYYEHEYVTKFTNELSSQDQKLINYLAKHDHWTPFSHVMITMREKVPIFVARQRFKHMVGFTYNEVSRRYVDDAPEFYTPEVWRGKPVNAKQGSSDEVVNNQEELNDAYIYAISACKSIYETLLNAGVAPEQARMVLPQSMYTEYYVTGSLAAWARAYKLRSDPHAQKEIQELAGMWNEIIGGIEELKHSWKALTDGS